MKDVLLNLYDRHAKEEFISITQNLIYLWKNSKKRSKMLISQIKLDFSGCFLSFAESAIMKDLI